MNQEVTIHTWEREISVPAELGDAEVTLAFPEHLSGQHRKLSACLTLLLLTPLEERVVVFPSNPEGLEVRIGGAANTYTLAFPSRALLETFRDFYLEHEYD